MDIEALNALSDAKRDDRGMPILAYFRDQESSRWRCLVAGNDGRPLTFRSSPPDPIRDYVPVDADGLCDMVLTPPEPNFMNLGLFAVPAIVSEGEITALAPLFRDFGKSEPNPDTPWDVLSQLIEEAALREADGGILAKESETADGNVVQTLLNWWHQTLLCWFKMPDSEAQARSLYAFVASNDGIVAMTVDGSLRPLYSPAESRRIRGTGAG